MYAPQLKKNYRMATLMERMGITIINRYNSIRASLLGKKQPHTTGIEHA